MKIYAFSGLGADESVFKRLELNHELVPVAWIPPHKNEKITDYTYRLINDLKIEDNQDFIWLGVSFGGIIAQEANKILPAKKIILLSTITGHYELTWWQKLAGRLKLIRFIPAYFLKRPFFIISYFFGAENKVLLKRIINDTNPIFLKWALQRVLTWKSFYTQSTPVVRIHGDKDRLFHYPTKNNKVIKISNGTHFMIVNNANKISKVINQRLNIY